MKHLVKGKRLGRTSAHRKAMFSNQLVSLFQNERIKTTLVKAKELRSIAEKMITRAKVNNLHNKRIILKKLKDRDILVKLLDNIAPRYINRPGGYTRIYKLGKRKGDNSELALIELVEEFSAVDGGKVDKKKEVKKDAIARKKENVGSSQKEKNKKNDDKKKR